LESLALDEANIGVPNSGSNNVTKLAKSDGTVLGTLTLCGFFLPAAGRQRVVCPSPASSFLRFAPFFSPQLFISRIVPFVVASFNSRPPPPMVPESSFELKFLEKVRPIIKVSLSSLVSVRTALRAFSR
jgi:hypothetical protein